MRRAAFEPGARRYILESIRGAGVVKDMLQDGLEVLESERKEHMSRPTRVAYARGAEIVPDGVTAMIGSSSFDVDDDVGGGVLELQSRDFIIASADIVLAGVETLPVDGDKITETRAGGEFVYEVHEIGGERCYRFCDGQGVTLRIHTKEVKKP